MWNLKLKSDFTFIEGKYLGKKVLFLMFFGSIHYDFLSTNKCPENKTFGHFPDIQISGSINKNGQIWEFNPTDTDRMWKIPDILDDIDQKSLIFGGKHWIDF